MEIVLKNGEKITLDWNPIVLEYLEDYEGGIEQLREDIDKTDSRFRVFNFIIYCLISAVYPKDLGYREAVSLVSPNDLDKIIEFIIKNISKTKVIDNFNQEKKTTERKINKHRR